MQTVVPQNPIRFKLKKPLIALVIGVLISILWLSYTVSWQAGLKQIRNSNAQFLNQFVGHLDSQLARFKFLPQLIAKNQLLVELLNNPDSSPRVDLVNHFLEEINQITGASDTYLMNIQGMTLAASNWQSRRTFVGKNFSFRPYFIEASKGKLGHYFGLGTTSGERGYYFAYPITYAANIIGIIVIKMDLSNIEQRWSNRSVQFIVSDPDGVIFITTQPDWLYRAIKPLTEQQRLYITQTRRYSNITIEYLDIEKTEPLPDSSMLMHINQVNGKEPHEYLAMQQDMDDARWSVMILAPLIDNKRSSLYTVILVLLAYLLLLSLLLLGWQRHRRRVERDRFQLDAQKQLEQEVSIRTQDLRHEIEEHKQTENRLINTQGELIQTAKLAVLGQMSASISHELNNPLAAIRSYADNARQFLKLNQQQSVDENLDRIASLTERMGKISSQLKFFARKSSGNPEPVKVEGIIQTAIDIVSPQYKNAPELISIEQPPQELSVLADVIQLEQVLINLISNALNAISEQAQGQITIHCEQQSDTVSIHVDDNGPGIQTQHLSKIFDPFFTTRKAGLGLGLSISARIIESMQGSLSASNLALSGARFTLTLPIALPETGSQT